MARYEYDSIYRSSSGSDEVSYKVSSHIATYARQRWTSEVEVACQARAPSRSSR